eukprot:6396616-Karenia_brevis.AAC.1
MENQILSRMTQQDERIDKQQQQINSLQQNFEEIKGMVETLRDPRAGNVRSFEDEVVSTAGSASSAASQQNRGRVLIRGFCPFGSPTSDRIRKEEYQKHATAL